jgi:hypothetical protein
MSNGRKAPEPTREPVPLNPQRAPGQLERPTVPAFEKPWEKPNTKEADLPGQDDTRND